MKVRTLLVLVSGFTVAIITMWGMNAYYLIHSEDNKVLLSLIVFAPFVIIPLLFVRRKRKPQTASEIIRAHAKRNGYPVINLKLVKVQPEDLKGLPKQF